jgi:hypothetical protein
LTFRFAFDAPYQTHARDYWLSLLLTHLLAWGFLLLACRILPKAWQDVPVLPRRSRAVPWPSAWPRRPARHHDYERARLLAETPVIWLASPREAQRSYLWVFTGGSSVLLVLIWIAGEGSADAAVAIACLAVVVHLVLATWVASQATHSLAEARDSGALELLLSTPLTTEEIIEGYFGALNRLFRRPVTLFVCVEMALLFVQVLVMLGQQSTGFASLPFWSGWAALCLGMAVFELFAVARFGLWKGISTKSASRAFIQTILYVVVLPFGLGCFCYPLVGVIKNMAFINLGREQLRQRFRTIVTERFAGDETGERPRPPRPPPPHLPGVLQR